MQAARKSGRGSRRNAVVRNPDGRNPGLGVTRPVRATYGADEHQVVESDQPEVNSPHHSGRPAL